MTHSTDDPTERFSSRVDAYVAARPRYPREVIDYLRRAIGLTPDWQIVDVGSGTGIASELFLHNDNHVTAVEPNAPMRAAAEAALASRPNFASVAGSAEATTLPDNCADLIVAAQAFHWFDRARARVEFRRLLRPGGHVLLMWNDRKLSGTPFLDAYEELLIEFGTDYLKVRHNNITNDELSDFFAPAPWRKASFPNEQQLDFPALRNRLLSSSYTPPPGHPNHQPMLDRLRQIFDRHHRNGQVTIEYLTELFHGQPSGQPS